MTIVKSLLIGLTLLSFAYSANVTISGIVTDTAGVPISGAAVKLLIGGQNTTTGSNGSFTLLGNSTGIATKPAQSQSYQPVVFLTKGMLKLHIQEQSSVTIKTYNLQGCLLTSMHTTLSAGDHSVVLTNRSSGVYLYKVQINNNVYQVMSNSLCSYTASANTTQGTSAYSLSKQAKNLATINDTIRIRKDGCSDYLIPVHTSDTSGITVRMHLVLTVTDADGNVYHTVMIGTQTWTVENLKTTHYNDGTAIPLITDKTEWGNLTTGAYCWNNDSLKYKNIYGALYNWYAVNTGKLAPAGWHVPTETEWSTLSAYLGGDAVAGGALKDTEITYWVSNTGATNSSGFSALPGGFCGNDGDFYYVGGTSYWWSATAYDTSHAYYCSLIINESDLHRSNCDKYNGFSVRLVRNTTTQSVPDSPVLSSPSNGATTIPVTPTLVWNTVSGATTYRVQISTASTFVTMVINDSTLTSGRKITTTALNNNTTYYWRINAKNDSGTSSWSPIWIFTTTTLLTVTDVDGNVYHTIKIGTQTWTIENLMTTHYNGGTAIALITSNTASTGGYCWYNNDSLQYKSTYGALYNWYAVNTGKLAPAGWHVPTDAEWDTLENYLIAHGYNYDGTTTENKIAKALAAQTNWITSANTGAIGNNLNTNNSSSFLALPGGFRDSDGGGFYYIGGPGYWWSATAYNASDAYDRCLYWDSNYLDRCNNDKSRGVAVRLVKDN